MKRSCTLIVSLLALITIFMMGSANASQLSEKLVGGIYTRNTPGSVTQVTHMIDPGQAKHGLDARPQEVNSFYLQSGLYVFDITFRTGDDEGREGDVLISKTVNLDDQSIYQDNPVEKEITVKMADGKDRKIRVRDHGGMELLKVFPKNTLHVSFVLDPKQYARGSYAILVRMFERGRRQPHGDVTIPVFIAGTFEEVKESLKNADNETLKRFGLKRYSEVRKLTRKPWTGNVVLRDGGKIRGARFAVQPQVGMAITATTPGLVIDGGVITSVDGNVVRLDMGSGYISKYAKNVSSLTFKLATWSPVRGVKRQLTSKEVAWVNTFPERTGRDRYRDAVRELLELGVIHKGDKLSSNHYWLGEQLATQPQGVWIPVDTPQEVCETISVIDYDYSGSPVLSLNEIAREVVQRPGILSLGINWALNPIRVAGGKGGKAVAVSKSDSAANASASASQSQSQEMNQSMEQDQRVILNGD